MYPLGVYGPGKDGKTPARAWQGAPYSAVGYELPEGLGILIDFKEN